MAWRRIKWMGNNILEVYHKVKEIAENMRESPKPVILECLTFRMRGHEERVGLNMYLKNCLILGRKRTP